MYNFPLLGEFLFDSHRRWIVKTSLPEHVYTRLGAGGKTREVATGPCCLGPGKGRDFPELVVETGGAGGGEGGVH